ncbi:MAG: hypothetical protein WBC73_06255 [Phormidesmis sp.]
MTSGPYQSKLLRFAIAQYRQGIARHRVAVRTARSRAVMGTAVALLPVYAVANASQWLGQRLRRSLRQTKLPGATAKVAKLLNFSDFDESSLTLPALAVLETSYSLAEQLMAQTLLSVGACLSSAQVRRLSGRDEPRSVGLLKRIVGAFDRFRFGKRGEIDASAKITGVASDLETRSLVLIKGYTVAWYGLSTEQQSQLQQKIAALLAGEYSAYTQSLPFSVDLAVPERRNSLAWSVRSFWVEVLRVIAWLQRGQASEDVFRLSGGSAQLAGEVSGSEQAELPGVSRSTFRQLAAKEPSDLKKRSGAKAIDLAVNAVAKRSNNKALLEVRKGVSILERVASAEGSVFEVPVSEVPVPDENSDRIPFFETKATTIGYIEHPLERVLKWVDRLLLWLEKQWQMFKEWRSRVDPSSGVKK